MSKTDSEKQVSLYMQEADENLEYAIRFIEEVEKWLQKNYWD